MERSLTVILADYLTGRISTTEALRRSDMQAIDDLVRAVREAGHGQAHTDEPMPLKRASRR